MSPRVLIADDSAVARVAVAKRVRAAGCEVDEHASAASAMAADPTTLACALLDFDLGDGLGVEVAERLRSERGELPIAFFTTTEKSEVDDRVTAFGPVFEKPGEIDLAVDWIARHTRG
jgi:DNA-binding response OmpR family regulator